ncbi:MAG: YfiR family protein [Rhodocyclales bacterium]|nr:YfiR family protein [Rhodocyclales bacterium]
MRRRSLRLLLGVWLAAALALPGAAQEAADAPRLRDAVIFKLLLFVDWPAAGAHEAAAPFRLCVLDDGGHGVAMADLAGRHLRERPLALLRVARDAGSLRKCHAIFLDAGEQRHLAAVAAATREAPVLIIAEGDQAIQQGAAIALSTAGGRIVFDINLAAARAANLAISSKLLRVARSVFE